MTLLISNTHILMSALLCRWFNHMYEFICIAIVGTWEKYQESS